MNNPQRELHALERDSIRPGDRTSPSTMERLAALKRHLNVSFETLSSVFRMVGSAVVVCALSLLLFQDWQQGDDITKYLSLLGFTGLLLAAGLLCGRWLQEGKGARLFLALGLLSIPIHAAVMGALIHSQWPIGDNTIAHAPHWLWHAPNPLLVLALVALGGLISLATAWLGFRVLAPRSYKTLTFNLLLCCGGLLLPLRTPLFVAAMAVLMGCVVLRALNQLSRLDRTLSTPEGIFGRLLLLLPLAILLGRSVVVYSADAWMHALLSLIVYIALRLVSMKRLTGPRWRTTMERLSVIPIFCLFGFIGEILQGLQLPSAVMLPLLSMGCAVMLTELSINSTGNGHGFRWLAALTLVFGAVILWLTHSGFTSALPMLVGGAMVFALGHVHKQAGVCGLGTVMMLTGLGAQLLALSAHLHFGNWITLAVMGGLMIVSGSLFERYGLSWKTQLQGWFRSMRFEAKS